MRCDDIHSTSGWTLAEVPGETCTSRARHTLRKSLTLEIVNGPNEVRDFLVSRRAKVTPEQAGLPAGHNRRVPGLRRGEVAVLAGLSVEYYAKIERGAIDGASEQVLDAISRALQLDDAEREHLTLLARAADGAATVRRRPKRSPLELAADPGLTLTIYAAEPGSATAERLQLLGSWAASNEDSTALQSSEHVRTEGA
jgi:transcriptional regulator with XRE-family HTH domain